MYTNGKQNKLIRDPVHGYIEIPKELFPTIIDTPQFQRLRHIRQTGYSAFFPGASHNRFQHSLGVFHLGKLAFEHLIENSRDILSEECKINIDADVEIIERYRQVFRLACLLHDYGHLPFSHTGEVALALKATRKQGDEEKIFSRLDHVLEEMQKEDFPKDVIEYAKKEFLKRKNHEVISAILASKRFLKNSLKVDKELFIRMIIGVPHADSFNKPIKQFENILVEMLNSSLIDVDKLDYIIRDTVTSGYNGVSIDVKRLIESLTIAKMSAEDELKLSYDKSAISILEHVVFANNWQRRWIQSHPTILYEDQLLQTILANFYEKTNFTIDKMEQDLINDSDVLSFAKESFHDKDAVDGFFVRVNRQKPLWKTEADFNVYLPQGVSDVNNRIGRLWDLIEKVKLVPTESSIVLETKKVSLNSALIKLLEDDIAKQKKQKVAKEDLESNKKLLDALKILQEYFLEKEHVFDMTIVFSRYASQGKAKDMGDMLVYDKNTGFARKLKDFLPHLDASDRGAKGELFYVYYTKNYNTKEKIMPDEVIGKLISQKFLDF